MTRSYFPNFEGKHDGTPLINAEHFVSHLIDDSSVVIPEAVILGYSPRLLPLLQTRDFVETPGYSIRWKMWLRQDERAVQVGVVEGFGIGAPGAAIVVEELAALGVKRFINLGATGALATSIDLYDAVLCTGALRDEGVSHHYLPPSRYAYPSTGLTQQLRKALSASGRSFHEGPTWTIDAIFRETVEEAIAYRDEGVLTVDMEASAIFTVGKVRGVETASLFWVSDHLLVQPEWTRAPMSEDRTLALAHILDAALAVLEQPA